MPYILYPSPSSYARNAIWSSAVVVIQRMLCGRVSTKKCKKMRIQKWPYPIRCFKQWWIVKSNMALRLQGAIDRIQL
jgi:hypothetical protein